MPDDRLADGDVGASLRSLVPHLPQPADRFEQVRARVERRRRRRLAPPVLAAAATAALLLVVHPLGGPDRRADHAVATPAVTNRLSASPWYLFELTYRAKSGRTAAAQVPASTLTFDASGTFSSVACDSTVGRVTITADRLRFADITTTQQGCGGDGRFLDRVVRRLVTDGTAWSVRTTSVGSELRLTVSTGEVLRYWSPPKPRGAGSGVAWPSCDIFTADLAQQEASGPPLIQAVPLPVSFRPVGVVRCTRRYTALPDESATAPTHGAALVQEQSTDGAAIAAVAAAFRRPDVVLPKEMACPAVGYPALWVLLVDAAGRYVYPRTPSAGCGGPPAFLTNALARTPFAEVSTKAYPTPAVTTATDSAAEKAAARCAHVTGDRSAHVSSAFATTAGVVKAHRMGPSRSPAGGAWASVPDAQVAYWCELRVGSSYSVTAVTEGAGPVDFVTSSVPLLTGPDGPLVP